MKQDIGSLTINGVEYVRKSDIESSSPAPSRDGLPLVIIRSEKSGVHYGYLKSRNGQEVELLGSRRLWYWSGAASLSQLALEGTSSPSNCKFTVALPSITVLGVIEVIPVSSVAKAIIDAVKIWRA